MGQSKTKTKDKTSATTPIATPGAASSTSKRKHKSKDSSRRLPKSSNPKMRINRAGSTAGSSSSKKPPSNAAMAGEDFLAFDFESEERKTKGKGKAKASVDGAAHHSLTPWADRVDWEDCERPAQMLHYEVMAFVDWMSPRREEHELRALVIEQIRRAVKRSYKNAEVTAFGSFETTLYLPSGDLDLVITIPDVTNPLKVLFKLPSIIGRDGVGKAIQVISKARVPIVKFTSIIGEFAVDISINMTGGIAAGRLVNRFLFYHPALKYLVIVVKTFLSQRLMNEVHSGGLGSYSIVLICLSFLQMHPKVRNGEIDPMENLGVLLIDFFELYGHYFRYETVGISLRNGGFYFRKDERDWLKPQKPFLLSIEDPMLPSNDVSGGTHSIGTIRRTFAGAYEVLNATMIRRSTEIKERRIRELSTSILGCIIGITGKMDQKRHQIHDIYRSGAMHDILGIPYGPAPPIPKPDEPTGPEPEVEDSEALQSGSLATLPESKAAGSQAQTVAEGVKGRKKRRRTPSREITGQVEEDDTAEDTRYAAAQPKRRRKQALDITFIPDNEGSDGFEMVTELAKVEAGTQGSADAQAAVDEAQDQTLRKAKNAIRRDYWQAKAGAPDDEPQQ